MSCPNESLPNLELNQAKKDTSECEAAGCNAKATATMAVPVGNNGLIFVSVCQNCTGKFSSRTVERRHE
jgi:hypothetical protein